MKTFIAIYRGETVASARIIAVTADSEIVSDVISRLLDKNPEPEDPVVAKLDGGRRGALRVIKREAERERRPPKKFHVVPGFKEEGREENAVKPTE